jgi:phosphoketolase
LQNGAIVLHESSGRQTIVFAVVGDVILKPVDDAVQQLEAQGYGVRVVSVLSPRRLYRPTDLLWQEAAQADGHFLDDAGFEALFGGDCLVGVTGGPANMLEPVLLRSRASRDVVSWKRGETTATAAELMAFNGITAEALSDRALALLG